MELGHTNLECNVATILSLDLCNMQIKWTWWLKWADESLPPPIKNSHLKWGQYFMPHSSCIIITLHAIPSDSWRTGAATHRLYNWVTLILNQTWSTKWMIAEYAVWTRRKRGCGSTFVQTESRQSNVFFLKREIYFWRAEAPIILQKYPLASTWVIYDRLLAQDRCGSH